MAGVLSDREGAENLGILSSLEGHRQWYSTGNIASNTHCHIIEMSYMVERAVKNFADCYKMFKSVEETDDCELLLGL